MDSYSDIGVSIFGVSVAAWIFYLKYYLKKGSLGKVNFSETLANITDVSVSIGKYELVTPKSEVLKTSQSAMSLLVPAISCARSLDGFDDVPIVLGIAGGSGSGKTTLARAVVDALGEANITYISHDSYYKDISHLSIEKRKLNNFDHPNSLDTPLLIEHVKALRERKPVRIPQYDYTTHSRLNGLVDVYPKRIILVEGILIFSDLELCSLMDIKIFVDTADDIRLIRRIQRDTSERGRTLDSVVDQYIRTVRPMHLQFVEPSKHNADIIIPVGVNSVALDLLVSRLKSAITDAEVESGEGPPTVDSL